ncbi:competence protein ComA [Ignicoccus islandicus DSM 13165]|uniref:indole-3-glycerol-phosphate synthase n=1 Tax=Ignicoccus islandicus DSM 13165 TaxID=940295 RepID=A0A0U2U6T9_9CREN|nr:molybdopterin-binding protein [Ignicoccus islandicus]ALU11860.1 competence protein ComA [Ignicoccus islandicus DSM 13165]
MTNPYLKKWSAAILVIGNEVLVGRITDTNSQKIARVLTTLGFDVVEIRKVRDDIDAIAEAVKELCYDAGVVITTGGLGPTYDDVTAEAIAYAIGSPLCLNEEALEMVRNKLREIYGQEIEEVDEVRRKMAVLPCLAQPIPNKVGVAPGIYVKLNRCKIFSLPGVPREMEAMLNEFVTEELQKENLYAKVEVCERLEDVREAELAPLLKKFAEVYPDVYIKSHPGIEGERSFVRVCVLASGPTKENAQEKAQKVLSEFLKRSRRRLEIEMIEEIVNYTLNRIEFERKSLALPKRDKKGVIDFRASLEKDAFSIITEFKPSSPSGVRAKWAPIDYVNEVRPCSSAFSVLTEPKWFKGSYENLRLISSITDKPILMKDFVVDPFQIDIAYAFGADAVLLMVDVLGEDELSYLARKAKARGLQTLVEVSNKEDLVIYDKKPYVDVLGMNSRDFKTLKVDINRLHDGGFLIRRAFPLAESGVKSPEDAMKVASWGFRGALVGTSLMESNAPRELCVELKRKGSEALSARLRSRGLTPSVL